LFTKNLMERLPSPLTPGAWRDIVSKATSVHYQFTAWGDHWWNLARPRQRELSMLAAGALGLYLLLKLVFRSATSRRRRRAEPPLPTFFERAVSAVWVALLRAIPVLAASLTLYIGLDALDLMQGNPWGRLVPTFLRGIIAFAGISALVVAVLAPTAPQW